MPGMHLVKEVNRYPLFSLCSKGFTSHLVSLPGRILCLSLTGLGTMAITSMVTTIMRLRRWQTMAQLATCPETGEGMQQMTD